MAELYNLKTDPGENNNLLNLPAHDAKKRELQVQLAEAKIRQGYIVQ